MLLVRKVSGPARARVGEPATYQVTGYNQARPSAAERAKISWLVESGGVALHRFRHHGATLRFVPEAALAGRRIRVMPYRNAPSATVAVETLVEPAESDVRTASSVAGKVVEVSPVGRRYFATVDGGPRFYVASAVTYGANLGLMNARDRAGPRYDPARYRDAFGFWADFILPTALCESEGCFHRLNTYDDAAFTFGLLQHAAHTPGENLALLLRALLALPEAAGYFPELRLQDGIVHRLAGGGSVPLEGRDPAPLMTFLNPSKTAIDDAELVNAARLVHWAQHDPEHRDAQVRFAINDVRAKLRRYARDYPLDGLPDTVCLVVMDIRHQGRAKHAAIRAALAAADPLERLLKIGERSYPERIRTLRQAIARLTAEGVLGQRVYDRAAGDFVPLVG